MINKSLILLFLSLVIMENASSSIESDFFRNPEIQTPILSPSGEFSLMLKSDDSKYNLALINSLTQEEKVVAYLSQYSTFQIADYQWIDQKTIAFLRYHKHQGITLFIYRIEKAMQPKKIATLENTYIKNALPLISNKFIAARLKNNGPQLFKIDLSKEQINTQFRGNKKISRGPLKNGKWLVNAYGKPNVNYEISKKNKLKVYARYNKQRKWSLIWDQDKKTEFTPIRLNEQTKKLLVISNKDNGFNKLYSFNILTKEFEHVVFESKDSDLHSILFDPYTDNIIGYSHLVQGIEKQVYIKKFSPGDTSKDLHNSYIVDFSKDKRFIIYSNSSLDKPQSFYLFDKQKKSHVLIGNTRPWLNQYKLGVSKVISSTSADGLQIESYLTLPRPQERKYPLIVMPHGGPLGVQDSRQFSTDIQYLIQKGYAVLTTNYRGSYGYGEKFLNSGKRQWGRLIEDDIASAVNHVLKTEPINSNQVCIFGMSYGGYSALISAISRPDLYKCAISYAGVTDITLLFSQSKSDSEQKEQLTEILGSPNEDWDTIINYSPVYRLKDLTIPIFVAHGGRDRAVDDEHYFRLIYMLNKLSIDYSKLYFKNEIHGFSLISNKIEFYRTLDNFVHNSLGIDE